MDPTLIGCTLQWTLEPFTIALVFGDMENGLYLIALWMIKWPLLSWSEVVPPKMDAQRQHQEEENQMRKEARDSCMAKDFAQRMLEWGRIVHDHYDNMRRFMEVRVRHPSVFILVPIMQFSSYMHQISIYFRLLLCTVACRPHLFLHSCLPCFSLRHMVFHHLHVPLLKM